MHCIAELLGGGAHMHCIAELLGGGAHMHCIAELSGGGAHMHCIAELSGGGADMHCIAKLSGGGADMHCIAKLSGGGAHMHFRDKQMSDVHVHVAHMSPALNESSVIIDCSNVNKTHKILHGTVSYQGGRTSSEYHMTARSLSAFLSQLGTLAKTAFIFFHVDFCLGMNPGSTSIYHDRSICKLPLEYDILCR